jgi:hypothetical protein
MRRILPLLGSIVNRYYSANRSSLSARGRADCKDKVDEG